MGPHRGVCGNCGAAAQMAAGWVWCCWNPTGCGCVAAVIAALSTAADRAARR